MTDTRKLAAILAADVVGYSRLAGADEDRILARLRALRSDLIDPIIAVHNGRVVKRTGDGALVEFRSVVDAVRCAIEMQNGMVERNAGVPAERRIEFRIGIHLGDVVEESDGDLMGDGVNIAARLEGIAKPGAICLSEDAYRQVKARLDLAVSDLGEQRLKNIAEPVRVYALEVGKPARAKPAAPIKRSMLAPLTAGVVVALLLVAVGAWYFLGTSRTAPVASNAPASATAEHLSIVVLPFANLSGDPSQDYLADVITDNLTAGLSRIRGSFVIARSTAFTYKGKPIDVKQIGQDLGVRYVLEGSEQQGGDRVRVNAQLISAETGAHLWADQFDTDRAELLTMQEEIVTRLARALEIRMGAVEAARVARTRPGDQDAEDLALRCQVGTDNSTPGSAEQEAAFDLCERALQIDGRNVLALSITASKYGVWLTSGLSADPPADMQRAENLVARALAIEPDNYRAHVAKSVVLMAQKRHEEALVEAERGLDLNPSYVPAYATLCLANYYMGRPEKTLEIADRAIRLSPRDPYLYLFYFDKGLAYAALKEDAQAIDWYRRVVAMAPQFTPAERLLAAELALNGQEAEAREMLQRYLSLKATRIRTIAQFRAFVKTLSDNPAFLARNDRTAEGLRKAGMPEE